MKSLLTLIMIFLFQQTALAESDSGGEKLLVLPSMGYSDEQGLGLGANGAWLSISGSGWNLTSQFFSSAIYAQTYVDFEISNKKVSDVLYMDAGGSILKSSRALFYGLGNDTSLADATQFAVSDGYSFLKMGFNFPGGFVGGLGINNRTTGIDRGADLTLPQFYDRWSTNPYITGVTTTSLQYFFMYDTRTPTFAPQSGDFIYASLDQSQPLLGQPLSNQKLMIQGQHYFPISEKDFIVLVRGRYDKQWGENVPFFLQSRIGGMSSMRAYRTNRYIDQGSMVYNAEARWAFWETGGSVFERFELSAGIDMGRVFNYENIPPSPWNSFHTSYDYGLTGLLAGGIPIRLDYAPGAESTLFYLHLFYPF